MLMETYKKIGIIGAMDVEVAGIVQAMSGRVVTNIGGSEFYAGRIADMETVAVQSGVGKVNAAFAAATLAYKFAVDSILMTGIAGGIGGGLKALDAFVPDGLVQHDVSMIGCEDGYIDLVGETVIRTDAKLSDGLARTGGAKRGVMATGEQFVDSAEQIAAIRAKFPAAVAVDMEAAAVAQVCARLGLPFACLKVISDDGTSGETYYDFKTVAAEKAVGAVLALIKQL